MSHPFRCSTVRLVVLATLLLALTACSGPYSAGWGDAGALHRAAHRGDVRAVEAALAMGADPNEEAQIPRRDYTGRKPVAPVAPLTLAIQNGKVVAARALMKAGAEVKPFVIPHAVSHGEPMIRALLDGGLDPNAPVPGSPFDGATALHWAVYYENPGVVKLLLERGADPNARAKDGETPLMCFWWHETKRGPTVARLLIAAGADPAGEENPASLAPGWRPRPRRSSTRALSTVATSSRCWSRPLRRARRSRGNKRDEKPGGGSIHEIASRHAVRGLCHTRWLWRDDALRSPLHPRRDRPSDGTGSVGEGAAPG